jgi:phytoene desaturase
MAVHGCEVTVFEKNSYPGGKLCEMHLGDYRFDKGPSLLTLPNLIDELTELSGYPHPFRYTRLKTLTRYFFEDKTVITASSNIEEFAKELKEKLQENDEQIIKHFKKSAFYYTTTADLFLHQSLRPLKKLFNLNTSKGILLSPFLNLLQTMHGVNKKFKDKKTTQIFNRYATYNGSNPYSAPALLNIIPHLEFGLGAYLPEKGMHQITEHLCKIALHCGVKFKFDSAVDSIVIEEQKIKGLKSQGVFYPSDLVISDMDIHALYNKLLPEKWAPKKLLEQEKSSSAYVFYWGIKKEFKELDLHNILFSDDYEKEFEHLFQTQSPYRDPTVYINITSKLCKADAPKNCENWFVMVNVPHNRVGAPIPYAKELRANVIKKINRILNVNIEEFIEQEEVLDPMGIEKQTSSYGGSLYGNASNTKFSAFLRHSNYSSKLKGLYFVGGSVHPGGGIPLCLLSAKITSNLIKENYAV